MVSSNDGKLPGKKPRRNPSNISGANGKGGSKIKAGQSKKPTVPLEAEVPLLSREKATVPLEKPVKPSESPGRTYFPGPTPALYYPPLPNFNPSDATLKLPDLDLEIDTPNPSTDFGAGKGPGTFESPRVLSSGNIECAYASDVGRLRTNNEDSAVAFLGKVERSDNTFGFFALADGMGGHENGEVASNIAVRKMMDGIMRDFYLPSVEGKPLGIAGETPTDIMASLINDANQAILTQGINLYRSSMGTTLSCIILYGMFGIVGHVGDSRIYVVEKETNEMRLITQDHSMVQRLVEAGQLSPEEAPNHPHRSILYMSLGQRGLINPFTTVVPLADLSQILLCSDGLWDMVEDSAILKILLEFSNPEMACKNLIKAANEAGGEDNVTVMVIKL